MKRFVRYVELTKQLSFEINFQKMDQDIGD